MKKPTLVIMAAGMGSRFGGCKQITPVDDRGHIIIDYSIYDAIRAGFGQVICIIKPEMAADFRAAIGDRIAKSVDLKYAYQTIDRLPDGYRVPEGRIKPWGTAHAVLCAADQIEGDFAAINADDFYGRNTFEVMAAELSRPRDRKGDYCMVAFQVGNTMSEGGTVSRGVCHEKNGFLDTVVERTDIGYAADGTIEFTDENGNKQKLAPETPVSMNMWGFTTDYFDYSEKAFVEFLKENIDKPKAEYFIPSVVNQMINSGLATVRVLKTSSKWFGVTYANDRPVVVAKFAELHASGEYPEKMF